MDKRRAVAISGVHFVWAIGLCLGAYYIEYGIMSIFMRWGVFSVIAANVLVSILLFLAFYFLEKKLVEQNASKPALFILASYVLPFAYQWIMLVRVNEMYAQSDSEGLMLTILFTFTCLLLGIGLIIRSIVAFIAFAKRKMEENKPLI